MKNHIFFSKKKWFLKIKISLWIFQYFSVWFFLNQLYTFWNARKSCFWWNSGRVDPLYRPIELKIFFGVTQNEFKLVPSCNRERLWVYATQRRWDRLGRVLGHHEACRKSLEHSRMTEPLRRAATVSLCHSMPTVAVAQSSWIVPVPSCMLHCLRLRIGLKGPVT